MCSVWVGEYSALSLLSVQHDADSVYFYRNTGSPKQKSAALGAHAGPAPGWKTKTHRRYISKDRELLKQLERACSTGNDKTRKFI